MVAKIDTETGNITPRSSGETTITVRTSDNILSATCTVTVDMRDKVIVEKNDNYFTVTFASGAVWKNIGCDLSKEENRSGYPISHEYDSRINEPERRYLYNYEEPLYSTDELALLYILDPLGVQYYAQGLNLDRLGSIANILEFKDNLYKKIFGNQVSGRFYFIKENETIKYIAGTTITGDARTKVFSNAEVLFGFHVVWDFSNMMIDFLKYLFEQIPAVSSIQTGVEIYQALFHAGSIVEISADKTSEYVEQYVNASIDSMIEPYIEKSKARQSFDWMPNLLKIIFDVANLVLSNFIVPNPNDVTIYNTINHKNNYRVVLKNGSGEILLSNIIPYC